MSEFLRNIRQVRIWTPRRHPRRWRSWGLWRRWLYRRRRWQPSSRLVYPASSGCSSSAATASHATAPGLGWWIASEICPPFQTWKDFSSQNCRLIFKWFRRRRIGTQPTKALLIPTVRHTKHIWYTTRQSFSGRVDQIYDNFKPSSKVAVLRRRDVRRRRRRDSPAGVTHGAGARTCLQSSFLRFCEHYNAELLLLCKNNAITQNYWFYAEITQNNKNSKTMKSRKYNDCITHINNRLKHDNLPIQCLTAGAATFPSMRNVFSQTLHNHYAYFLNYYAKNVTQSLRRHYANIITQDVFFTHTLRNTFTQKLRKNYASITQSFTQNTQILRKYFTQ